MRHAIKLGAISVLYDSLHKTPKNYIEIGLPMIRVTDIKRGFISTTGTKKVDRDTYEEFSKKHKPDIGDILFTRVGSYGNSCYVDRKIKFCLGQNTVCIQPDKDIVDSYFLYCFLNTTIARDQIDSFIGGASQPTISLKNIKELSVPLPSLEQQRVIATAVRQYDNLIENNNRRITILEEIAQSLYQEWFVKFRYPGYEDQKLVDSALGLIPDGWEVKSAAACIQINPRTIISRDGEKPFVPMSALSQNSMTVSDIEMKSGNSGAKYINGDTLFARITPCLQNGKTGYVQFLTEDQPVGFGSTEFIVLRNTVDLGSEFIYLLARSRDFRENAIKSMTGATGRQRVQNGCFSSYYLAVPVPDLMARFAEQVAPTFRSVFNLTKRNKNLREQRDMLLPKLISGKMTLN